MPLEIVDPRFVDFAWADGASSLGEACDLVDEITPSQLKLILSRGERHLVRMTDEGNTIGWGAFRVDQLPNVRVLFVTDLVAHNGHFERFWDELKSIAKSLGCSRIRCCAKDAQSRLYRSKLGMTTLYSMMEASV